jgi:hypothetical protein
VEGKKPENFWGSCSKAGKGPPADQRRFKATRSGVRARASPSGQLILMFSTLGCTEFSLTLCNTTYVRTDFLLLLIWHSRAPAFTLKKWSPQLADRTIRRTNYNLFNFKLLQKKTKMYCFYITSTISNYNLFYPIFDFFCLLKRCCKEKMFLTIQLLLQFVVGHQTSKPGIFWPFNYSNRSNYFKFFIYNLFLYILKIYLLLLVPPI